MRKKIVKCTNNTKTQEFVNKNYFSDDYYNFTSTPVKFYDENCKINDGLLCLANTSEIFSSELIS